MAIENYDFVGSYNNQRFPNIDAERSINLFEYIDQKGKKPNCLISTSGLQNTNLVFPNTSVTDGFRAEYVLNGFEYFVVGQNIYRRDSNNVVIQLNSSPLPTTTGYVGVDANNAATGPQIVFVDGHVGAVWDTGTNQYTPSLKAVDAAFPDNPIDITFLDGFLVVTVGGTNEFELSGFNNAYSWSLVNATFTADAGTDKLLIIPNTTSSGYIPTGMPIQFSLGGGGVLPTTIPTALNTTDTFFAIFSPSFVGDTTHIRIATSFANAAANIFLDITAPGNPTVNITNLSSPGLPGQLQQGQINTHPGNIVACRTLHRRLFLFSSNFTEVWENAGSGTNLPFRRNNGLLMEYGTPSVASIVTGFDKMMFLSQDRDGLGAVMELIGTEAIPVSNRALDFQLAQYASGGQIADARGIFVKENGIIFYRLNFTAANHTFVYNLTMSDPTTEEGRRWHEEETLSGNRHPAQTHGYFNGNNYYGSYNSPILYQVDNSFPTNDGEIIPRIRIGRPIVPSTYNRTRIDRFMLDVIQGLTSVTNFTNILNLLTESSNNIDTENGFDLILDQSSLSPIYDFTSPTCFLSYSKDGGLSYGNQLDGFVGGTGQRTTRTVWRKLGVVPRGQAFVPKVEFYFNVPFIVLGAAWAYEIMPE